MELELGEEANDHSCRELRRKSTEIDVETLAAVGVTIASHPTLLTISVRGLSQLSRHNPDQDY